MSSTRSANGLPSVRTQPRALPSRSIAFIGCVDSQATYVPDSGGSASRASVLQVASACATPPPSISVDDDTNTMFASMTSGFVGLMKQPVTSSRHDHRTALS
jgi:hypothetical protein